MKNQFKNIEELLLYISELVKKDALKAVIRRLINIVDSEEIFTHRHSSNVMRYSIKIARALKLTKENTKKIMIAGLLHDVGKVGIDRSILCKRGRLTEEEWKQIKRHPAIGASIIEKTGIRDDIEKIIINHHAKFNGGGYPNKNLKGKDIPLASRIIAVADAYEAMTHERPYRNKTLTDQDAIKELRRCAGTQFDPRIVNAFAKVII